MKIYTWQKELAVVIVILATVWFSAKANWIEALGSLAVILTFCHTQVAFRLEEQQERSDNPHSVECYKWQSRYFCAKEICWLGFFVAMGAWSALVGVFVFLAYPWWRKWWLKHPEWHTHCEEVAQDKKNDAETTN